MRLLLWLLCLLQWQLAKHRLQLRQACEWLPADAEPGCCCRADDVLQSKGDLPVLCMLCQRCRWLQPHAQHLCGHGAPPRVALLAAAGPSCAVTRMAGSPWRLGSQQRLQVGQLLWLLLLLAEGCAGRLQKRPCLPQRHRFEYLGGSGAQPLVLGVTACCCRGGCSGGGGAILVRFTVSAAAAIRRVLLHRALAQHTARALEAHSVAQLRAALAAAQL